MPNFTDCQPSRRLTASSVPRRDLKKSRDFSLKRWFIMFIRSIVEPWNIRVSRTCQNLRYVSATSTDSVGVGLQSYACFPAPKTTISFGLCRRTIRREEASAVLNAVSSSAFIKLVGRPSLSINVRDPREVRVSGSGSSGSLLGGAADLAVPKVTTVYAMNVWHLGLEAACVPFIPIPAELVEGINSVVVPFFRSSCCRSGCWKLHSSLSLFTFVEYSWRASRRVFCNVSTSSLARPWRTSLTSASFRIVRQLIVCPTRRVAGLLKYLLATVVERNRVLFQLFTAGSDGLRIFVISSLYPGVNVEFEVNRTGACACKQILAFSGVAHGPLDHQRNGSGELNISFH